MPYNRFLELIKIIPKIKQEERKEELITSAFTAFQLGAGGDKTFGQYLQALGLAEKKKIESKKITKEEALAIGQRIHEKAKLIKAQRGN